ncbi:MAG: MoxR family ATPase [Clostridiales bacterium]|nr:MoxR family ATPase [Clostridiales bacterium]
MPLLERIRQNIKTVMIGKDEVIDRLLIALICSGHVLIEDMPGTGKTTLVSALASSLGCSFRRIQFTPDILPADITGFTMFNMRTGELELHEGSIMNQIVLADEINRTSPKTQSALLEVMQENQVTIDGKTYPAPSPFMVLATQNPVEMTGTYPLPEAQLDRFLMRISMGYPSHQEELDILRRHRTQIRSDALSPVATAEDVLQMQRELDQILCADTVMDYIVSLAEMTRSLEEVQMGISPRGAIALMQAAKGCAMLEGRSYVLPDDVQKMAIPVLAHRLVTRLYMGTRRQTPEDVIRAILCTVPVPAVK